MDGSLLPQTQQLADLLAMVPPNGFILNEGGLFKIVAGQDGVVSEQRICSPLAVVAKGLDTEGNGHSRKVVFVDADGNIRKKLILVSDIFSAKSRVIADLLGSGLELSAAPKADKDLLHLLKVWTPEQKIIIVHRHGWVNQDCRAFVLGADRIIGQRGYALDAASRPIGNTEIRASGMLSDWQTSIGNLCQDNPVLIFAVSLALAAPLLDYLGNQGAGFHLRGSSSTGKSTVLAVANSVWGAPQHMKSWRTTANVLIATEN